MLLSELTDQAQETLEGVETDDELVALLADMGIELGDEIERALRAGDPMVAVLVTGAVVGATAARGRAAAAEVTLSAPPGPAYARTAGGEVRALKSEKREIAPGDDQWVLSGLEKAL